MEEAYANYVRKHRASVVEVGSVAVAKSAPRLAVKNFIIIVQFVATLALAC